MQDLQHLKLDISALGVATIQIANDTALNILDSETIVEFTRALRSLARNLDVRVLVLQPARKRSLAARI
ncbi:hypothetical protein D8I24_3202 (plasmid) [Cupriavidus necator H850]|uniref:hypothetical protein n=1 Tax=Cupriavidus necator TaxID=106590 RepID=UPI00129E8D30|nr:hypothetical protein [Cupriavidus necator]KAI3603024.1 hypothetical protein D8I24_3202 [Cupriavidus necator H850]